MRALSDIRQTINPPYSGRDLLIILGVLVILVSIPLTTLLSLQRLSTTPKAATSTIEFDSASSKAGTHVSSLTWPHNVGFGDDRILVVGVSFYNNPLTAVTGVTYNGTASTQIGWSETIDNYFRIYLFRLVAPSIGTHSVVVTFSGQTSYIAAGATSWFGVHQTTPTGPFAAAHGFTSSIASVSVNSAIGEVVVDVLGAIPNPVVTAGSNQIGRWNTTDGYTRGAGSSEQSSGPSVTMSWTLDPPREWAIGAVPLKPAPAPEPPPPPAPTANIKANDLDGPITITYNTAAKITWTSTNADNGCSVSPTGWTGTSNTVGVSTGNLTSNKTYTLSCSNAGGSASDSVTVNVSTPPKPTVSIQANPASITSGQSSTLSWSCTPNDGTVSVGISSTSPPNIGTVSCNGSKTVTPGSSISYTAIASGPGGTSDPAYTSITVDNKPPPAPPKPSVPKPPSLGAGTLDSLQLEISVPYLIGKLKTKIEVGGVSKEVEITGGDKSYTLDLKGNNLSLNKEYNLAVTSEKTLVRKVKFTPTSAPTNLKVSDLILGDLNQDNKIDSTDQLSLVNSTAKQNLNGDINDDKVVNSFDWAILLTNFGKNGD
ncbi:MAG: hypothetical protein A2113_04320 [Candidatus Woykebacteria bacterium GWA1_44_8]|uniref:Dockerin domain-containing protein n=1 Tax=Candidatus Woykebacteria bacterium GWA1_44_8 TaxID=1802591 RepID=A0A1G1W164_9BACT|nr:MAG: hypothetical protein A2113_04320 [Candidatus Woykebacteria bacterium GWA1_44_8]